MPLQAPKKHVTGESHLSGKQKQIPLVHKSHEIPYSISIHFSIFILCVLFYFFPFSSYLNTSNLPKTHPSHRKSDLNFLLKERCWRQILIQILEGQGLSPLNHFNLFYIFLGILAKKTNNPAGSVTRPTKEPATGSERAMALMPRSICRNRWPSTKAKVDSLQFRPDNVKAGQDA